MQVNVEAVSPVKKKLTFEIPAERVDREIAKTFENIRKRTAIKGFRKGKAPQSLIEKNYSDVMADDVLRNLFNETFYEALREHRLYPLSQPVIEPDMVKKGEVFRYSAIIEVMPEVELKEYTGFKLVKEKFVLNPEVVEKRLAEMRESMAQLEPVAEPRPIVNGDFVLFDFQGFVDGKPLEHGSAENYQLEIGGGQFIPGFEEQLIGLEPGMEKTITVTFPETYHNKDIAGKPAEFKVKVREIRAKVLPDLDDDFAKNFGEFDTLDALKAKLAEHYEQQEKEQIEGKLRDSAIKAVVEKNPVDVPDSLVEKQLDHMLESARNRLSAQKLSLEMVGFDDTKFRQQFREEAIQQVKGELLLDAISSKEGIRIEESDIEKELERLAASVNQSVDAIRGYFSSPEATANMSARLRVEKTIALLLEKSEITEVKAEKPAK